MLGDLVDPELDPADDIPPPEKKAITRTAELWELGPHRLLCGDALSAADLRRLMCTEPAAMVITDPPFILPIKPEFEVILVRSYAALKNVLRTVEAALVGIRLYPSNFASELSPGFTEALYDRLEDEFAAGALFMDVEGQIKPGDDFVEVLNTQVAAADVVFVVIGPRWADLLAAHEGERDDFVAIEIKAALDQGKRVIPVLVGGADMPRADTLPEAIRTLARRNAVGLRHERSSRHQYLRIPTKPAMHSNMKPATVVR